MESRNTAPKSVSKAQRPRTGGRGYCALCLELRTLDDSHIIPRTVVRQIQSLFPNKDLRGSMNPNVPRQDITTYPLLCRDCENTLSRHEGRFNQVIFHPYTEKDIRNREPFRYRDWLLPFIVGLTWRTWARDMEVFSKLGRSIPTHVQEAGQRWRAYLNGECNDPGTFEYHLVCATWKPLPVLEADPPPANAETVKLHLRGTLDLAPTVINALQGTISSNLIVSDDAAWVFVNMGGAIAVAPIRPRRLAGFENTIILSGGGLLDPDRQVVSDQFREWLSDHALLAARRVWDNIGPTQREKSMQKTFAAVEREVASGSPEGKAFLSGLRQAEKGHAQEKHHNDLGDNRESH